MTGRSYSQTSQISMDNHGVSYDMMTLPPERQAKQLSHCLNII